MLCVDAERENSERASGGRGCGAAEARRGGSARGARAADRVFAGGEGLPARGRGVGVAGGEGRGARRRRRRRGGRVPDRGAQ